MRTLINPFAVFVFVIALAAPVWAEKVNMSPKTLHKLATHVVTGEATAIYERTEKKGAWKYTHCVVEIRVKESEKGNGIQKGNLIYARYWHRKWSSLLRLPPSTNGHRGLPKKGDRLRFYLARNAYDGFTNENNDGGFNVIGANGFERLK
ncbi:MAG: hypothetical protein AB8F34_00840 [Akkermansiaceae bacterium]